MSDLTDDGTPPALPWRITLAVRLWTPQGRPASVELDLGDDSHGCTVTLTPEHARKAARALSEAADRADAEMARWRAILDQQRADLLAAAERDMLGRAGWDVR